MPRISQQQKDQNRAKIVTAAGERFRARGVDGVGIDDLMSAAGMTHGGFYNHFSSKQDLAVEVFRQGFIDSLNEVDRMVGEHPMSARDALDTIIDSYVTADHRDDLEHGCASAALVVDAARHGSAAQAEYGRGLHGYLSAITDLFVAIADKPEQDRDREHARESAIGVFSEMVGALVLARATATADPALSNEVISSTRRRLRRH